MSSLTYEWIDIEGGWKRARCEKSDFVWNESFKVDVAKLRLELG